MHQIHNPLEFQKFFSPLRRGGWGCFRFVFQIYKFNFCFKTETNSLLSIISSSLVATFLRLTLFCFISSGPITIQNGIIWSSQNWNWLRSFFAFCYICLFVCLFVCVFFFVCLFSFVCFVCMLYLVCWLGFLFLLC